MSSAAVCDPMANSMASRTSATDKPYRASASRRTLAAEIFSRSRVRSATSMDWLSSNDLRSAVSAGTPPSTQVHILRTAAHGYRLELRDVGLKEPVTSVVPIGESLKSVDELLAAPQRGSKSDGTVLPVDAASVAGSA